MTQREILVVGTARTAIGTYGGSLKDTPLSQLATTAVSAALAIACSASNPTTWRSRMRKCARRAFK